MLTKEELRDYSRTDAFRTWFDLALDWTLIACGFALVILFPHPVTYLAVFVLMARQQLALAILMHDAAHKRLFKSQTWNDVVGQILTAAPVGFSMFSYRHLHLKHHQRPLAEDDPDLSLIGGYPIPKSSLVRKLARDLFGISYFKFIRYFIHMARKRRPQPETGVEAAARSASRERAPLLLIAGSIAGVQLLLLGCLWMAGHPLTYFFFWILPSWTVLQVLLRIRGIAEHAGYEFNSDQLQNARTVINPFQTFVFAPHNVNYHMEHHQYPSVPHWRLKQVHRLMRERDSLPEKNIYPGYGAVLRDLVR